MNTTGIRSALCLLLLMLVTLWLGWLPLHHTNAQDTGSLETECVVVASATSFVVPPSLTPQEYCKVLVALVGNEWLQAAKLEASIILANNNDVRLAAAEAEIVALKVLVAALQSPIDYQPQIDAINTKLAGVATALQ